MIMIIIDFRHICTIYVERTTPYITTHLSNSLHTLSKPVRKASISFWQTEQHISEVKNNCNRPELKSFIPVTKITISFPRKYSTSAYVPPMHNTKPSHPSLLRSKRQIKRINRNLTPQPILREVENTKSIPYEKVISSIHGIRCSQHFEILSIRTPRKSALVRASGFNVGVETQPYGFCVGR
jgi:hypothetical protein